MIHLTIVSIITMKSMSPVKVCQTTPISPQKVTDEKHALLLFAKDTYTMTITADLWLSTETPSKLSHLPVFLKSLGRTFLSLPSKKKIIK